MKSYSQMGQDEWVVSIFKKMTYGYFLDIGAGNGVDLSNTYVLENDFFWDGLCIEPNSNSFELLKKNRKCKISNDLVLDNNSKIMFTEYGDTGAHQDYFSSVIPFQDFSNVDQISKKERLIRTKPLFDVLKENATPTLIHYMSLDVEGCEFRILDNFFKRIKETNTIYRIMSLSVEHNFKMPDRDRIRNLLEENDYVYVKELFHDDLYVNKAFYPMLSL